MAKGVVVEYGPPGHKGIESIMGIGSTDLEQTDSGADLMKVGGGAVALWVAGTLTGMNSLKQIGFGAGLAVAAIKYLKNRRESVALTPTSGGFYVA